MFSTIIHHGLPFQLASWVMSQLFSVFTLYDIPFVMVFATMRPKDSANQITAGTNASPINSLMLNISLLSSFH